MSDEASKVIEARQKILALQKQNDWPIHTLMIAMSGMLTDMMKQGQTPDEWEDQGVRNS